MTSPFDDLDDLVSSAVLTAYGEAAVLRPRVSSQYVARSVDPDRPETTVWGVYSATNAVTPLKGQVVGEDFRGGTRVSSLRAEFWIGAEQAAEVAFAIQKGDAISFPGRPGEPVYEVVDVQPTDVGDINLILTSERPQT